MFCSKCGKEIEKDMQFCIHCGNKVSFPSSTENCESKVEISSSTKKSNSRVKKIVKIELIVFLLFILFIAVIISFSSSANRKNISKENLSSNSSIETEEEKQKRLLEEQKRKEEEEKISNIIKDWASIVRDLNQGSVKYKSHRKYATANDGKIIYMIVYDTGSKYSEYRQLVAIDNNLTEIKGTTKLYYYTYLSGGRPGSNQEQELKWEAEKNWGI